ncbi:MAG: hypothetical protein RLZ98_740 [Pseudomonadota bacterium]|jgi:alkylated DNA repair protein (DNA oxidative demethylase)
MSSRKKTSRTGLELPAGACVFEGLLTTVEQRDLYAEIERLVESAPFYVPSMPGSGKPLSVEMTNCGVLGWVADKSGYRYQRTHPFTGQPWPAMPAMLLALWNELAAAPVPPEACLVNRYRGKAKLGSHVDSDEQAPEAAIVSVSLGDDAVFHIGGTKRSDAKARVVLRSGDVVVMGGPARLAYHGIDRVLAGTSELVPGGGRINLTMRRVTPVKAA